MHKPLIQTSSPEMQALTKKNHARAQRLSDPWQTYYLQCQAYIYLNADLTLANEQELAKLIRRLENAQAHGIEPEVKLKRQPEAYGRAIMRYTKTNQPLVHATSVAKTTAIFIGSVLFLYALFQAIRGGFWYGSVADGLSMPVPISILGLSLQTALGFLAATLFAQWFFHSAFGKHWKQTYNIIRIVGLTVTAIFFMILPFLTLYYRVFVVEVPAWLIFGIALILLLIKVFTDYIPVADYIQNYIDNRARNAEKIKKGKAAIKAQAATTVEVTAEEGTANTDDANETEAEISEIDTETTESTDDESVTESTDVSDTDVAEKATDEDVTTEESDTETSVETTTEEISADKLVSADDEASDKDDNDN